MTAEKQQKQKLTKKQIREEVAAILEKSLTNLKDQVSEKKLKENIKKASKVLTSGISLKQHKPKVSPKKAVAKKAAKKAS